VITQNAIPKIDMRSAKGGAQVVAHKKGGEKVTGLNDFETRRGAQYFGQALGSSARPYRGGGRSGRIQRNGAAYSPHTKELRGARRSTPATLFVSRGAATS
jgi:hypothetical protein